MQKTMNIKRGYSKYRVAPVAERTIDGHIFASKREMHRYLELKLLQRAGKIKDLKLQPKFILLPAFKEHKAITYRPDFIYHDVEANKLIVEEVKGFATREYKIKAHLFEHLYPQYEYLVTK